jgi:hypothetical protein
VADVALATASAVVAVTVVLFAVDLDALALSCNADFASVTPSAGGGGVASMRVKTNGDLLAEAVVAFKVVRADCIVGASARASANAVWSAIVFETKRAGFARGV